ncbi:Panacea domain-containing protein [Leucobacter chromiireducens]|uniref:DUF4065 domain-containing protein n=1 Tax=Leucobacter chromiireducens subsp. chromiireducens TaxID=660067 RepID=A0ABS1SLV7_9MICO|nr:type II toxin-antitoxin system antitoxin SocA domain-containing protein [Leucobacter chromiireducens]MBL3688959.1 DUF4065 domain-containing protein [Leucobacter chromiireducens subsp. chromiireducens]
MAASTASIHDVAAFILAKFDGPISTMKLQKLCFFGQGWSLGISGEPLFAEDFHAWKNGPVNWDLYMQHRGKYSVSSWNQGKSTRIVGFPELIVQAMLHNYGALSGIELSELTHRPGTPWAEARQQASVSDGQRDNSVITKHSMLEYFRRELKD